MSVFSYLYCFVFMFFLFVFFLKQNTAYEMRISDWSSDVCSSDLCVTYESNGRKHFKEWTARGQSQLSAALNKVVPHVAPRPDQLVTDEQLMRLQNTADDVGADLQAFCKFMGTTSLKTIPQSRFDEAMDALHRKKKAA